jgi:hypothetical protein
MFKFFCKFLHTIKPSIEITRQDYGECTPTAEKNLMFPRFPASSDRPSLPMSQLVPIL